MNFCVVITQRGPRGQDATGDVNNTELDVVLFQINVVQVFLKKNGNASESEAYVQRYHIKS